MEIHYSTVKEISLVCKRDNGQYVTEELLRVSKGWISFVRKEENKPEVTWSLKSNDPKFIQGFDDLIVTMYHEDGAPHFPYEGKSMFSYNIRVTFLDNTYQDFPRNGSFRESGLINQCHAFLNLIPDGFQYPHALDAPLYKAKQERLNREILNGLKKEYVLAIMFAEGGAMGCPGEIQLVTEETIYYSNVFFKDNEVNIDMIIDHLFEKDAIKFNDIHCYFNHIRLINRDSWYYISLGMGNHLFVSSNFFSEYKKILLGSIEPERFKIWKKLIGLS